MIVLIFSLRWYSSFKTTSEMNTGGNVSTDTCTILSYGETQHDCYHDLAVERGDAALCEKIPKDYWAAGATYYEQCYFER
jgi:hypothetical protein